MENSNHSDFEVDLKSALIALLQDPETKKAIVGIIEAELLRGHSIRSAIRASLPELNQMSQSQKGQ